MSKHATKILLVISVCLLTGCELGNNGLQFSKKRAFVTCLQLCDTSKHNPSIYSVDGCNRCSGCQPYAN